MQSATEVYNQELTSPTYFGKNGYGNVIVVYYNLDGNEGWNDIWVYNAKDQIGFIARENNDSEVKDVD